MSESTVTAIPRMTHVSYDVFANFPTNPRLYDLAYATDLNALYYWNGAAWVLISTSNQLFSGLTDIKRIAKAAPETVNNSAVMQNDNELLFAMGANQVWFVIYQLLFDSSVGADLQNQISLPVGAVFRAFQIRTAADGSVGVGSYIEGIPSGLTGNGVGTARVSHVCIGIVVNGANAGNFQIQWAQNLAEVSNTTVNANSYIIGIKLA
jgi:hypothetical protein